MSLKNIRHMDSGNFIWLAGPCVVESEELLMNVAEKVSTEVLSLPMWPYISKSEQMHVVKSLKQALIFPT